MNHPARQSLLLRQPWAWLVVHAGKDVVNSGCNSGLRGRMPVHAHRALLDCDYLECADFLLTQFLRDRLPPIELPPREALARGGVVGSVEITGCVRASGSPWFVGPCGLTLRDPWVLPVVPVRARRRPASVVCKGLPA